MNFKPNEKIRAFVALGKQDKPSWQLVNVVESYDNEVIVSNGHCTASVEPNKAKHWIESSQDDLDYFAKNNFAHLVEIAKKAIVDLKMEQHLDVDVQEEDWILNLNNLVAIAPGFKVVESLTTHREIPAWEVSIAKYYPATRWEPEDVDMCPVDSTSNNIQAVNLAVVAVLKATMDAYFESVGEAMTYAEFE